MKDVIKTEPRREEEKEALSLSELQGLVKLVKGELRSASKSLRQEFREKPEDEKGGYDEALEAQDHGIIQKFVEKLESQKEKFRHIVETEKGSLYFILQSGESLRIRRSRDDEEKWDSYSVKPMMEQVVFVPSETIEVMQKMRNENHNAENSWIGTDFQMGECAVGMSMFEINMMNQSDRRMFLKKSDGVFRLVGSEEDGETYTDELNAAYHPTHKITRIVK